ncbi:MAG: N-acetyltransferase [Gammaproteobacteria bacterium]|nr:N-acetyltransferase [Gammaproteobacteria bacterium]
MKIRVHERIAEIDPGQWNGLVEDNHPFLRHEFLHAMEQHGCVGERFGWLPRHLAVYRQERLVAAMPLYEKYNSYGEFVFDHAWAEAYQRNSLSYYPKLVAAVPYTPARGQRLLAARGERAQLYPLLLQGALELCERLGASGFHCLFPTPYEQRFLRRRLFSRHDCQFHWRNRDYDDFDDFLARLTAKKRKNVRQERRRVAAAGVVVRELDGHTASEQDWHDFARFYNQTFQRKWGMATFNEGFFMQVAKQLPDRVVLQLADLEGECIAGALMYRSDTRLYGRHWGCTRQIDGLHFELCYYRGIEYCIRERLRWFEPGAQGEYKLARGFTPRRTRSSHWLLDSRFHAAIGEFCGHEQKAVADYQRQLSDSSPYRSQGGQR